MTYYLKSGAHRALARLVPVLGAGLVFAAGAAHAQATDAGKTVSNTFTLDYEVNNVAQPQITNSGGTPGNPDGPTIFTVDRLIDATVLQTNSPVDVAPGTLAADAALTFTVTNTGNDRQAYSFSIEDLTSQFDLIPGSLTIEYSIPAQPAFPAQGTTPAIAARPVQTGTLNLVPVGTTTALTQGSDFTPDIPAGASFTVTLSGNIPSDAQNAEFEDLVLVAETREPEFQSFEGASGTPGALTTGVNFENATGASNGDTNNATGAAQNVFADGAGTGADIAFNGRAADTGRFVIATPNLTGVKTVGVISTDGSGCSDFSSAPATDQFATSGACVEYIITVENLGADDPSGNPRPGDDVQATDIVIADTLAEELIFVAATTEDFAVTPAPSAGQPLPAANTSCDGTTSTCLVRYEGGAVAAPGNTGIPVGSGAEPTVARVRIRALVR